MTLYELTNEFRYLFEQFDEIDLWEPERDELGNALDLDGGIIPDLVIYKEKMRTAWFDTLTALEAEFNDKAENIACYIKDLTSDTEKLKAEEKRLRARRQAAENRANRLKLYLISEMNRIGLKKLDAPRARLTVRLNPPSVQITDERSFISWAETTGEEAFLKYSEPEIKKAAVKAVLNSGAELPYCRLERKESLVIK